MVGHNWPKFTRYKSTNPNKLIASGSDIIILFMTVSWEIHFHGFSGHCLWEQSLLKPWYPVSIAFIVLVIPSKIGNSGTSLVIQWLRIRAPNAGGSGSIPGQGTRSHMPQASICMLQWKIPCAATKTRWSQISKINVKKEKMKKKCALWRNSESSCF